jgi:hypothetical protein
MHLGLLLGTWVLRWQQLDQGCGLWTVDRWQAYIDDQGVVDMFSW